MADDTRVVQMEFDNRKFDRNIQTSQKSLDRFKKSLDFDSVAKGLKSFTMSIKDMAFDGIAENIQKLTDKFTGFGNAAEFIISRIRARLEGLADKAIGLFENLTVGQMSAGFGKYETLNKSVQTLLAATGKTEAEIYGVLDKLNAYTDQTSYDFSEGVTSISRLVSSGAADLETAERTIEGFYSMAAKAGASTSTATHALQYSLTQAMSLGYMGRNDWKTLESTSLATIDFKTQLLEAGVALGKVTKEGNKYYIMSKTGTKKKKIEVNATNLWNESLQEQWVTSQVLNKALERYADTTTEFGQQAYAAAQRCTTFSDALGAWRDMMSTGWMQTYRTVFGDLTDAMDLFSGMCDKVSITLDNLMSTINTTLSAWKGVGGRENLWGMLFGEIETPDGKVLFEGAYGVLDIFDKVGNMISDGFWNTFMNLIPRNEQQALLKMVNDNLEAFGLEKPFETFEELFNSEFFRDSGGREGLLGGALQGVTESVQNFIQGIHEWFSEVDENGVSRLQKVQNVLDAVGRTAAFVFEILGGVGHFIGLIGEQLGPSIDAIGDLLSSLGINLTKTENDVSNSSGITKFFEDLAEILRPFTGMINDLVIGFTDMISAIFGSKTAADGTKTAFQKFADVVKKVFGKIAEFLRPVVNFITTVFKVIENLFDNGFSDESKKVGKNAIIFAFKNMLKEIKKVAEPLIKGIGSLLQMLWDTVKEKLTSYFNDPTTFGGKIWAKVGKYIQPLFGWLKQVFGKISSLFSNTKKSFEGNSLFDIIKSFFAPTSEGGVSAFSNFLSRFKEITGIKNLKDLIGTVMMVVSLFTVIKKAFQAGKAWKKIGEFFEDPGGNLKQGFIGDYEYFSERILNFAKAIGILAAAVVVLGSLNTDSLIKGGGALAIIMTALMVFTKFMSEIKANGINQRTQMLQIASAVAAIAGLVLALLPLASVSWEGFAKMMAGLGVILLQMVGAMALVKLMKIDKTRLAGFAAFAGSIAILVAGLLPLANIEWVGLAKMMVGLGGILLQLIGFMLLTSYLPIGTKQLGGFIKFALSIAILVFSLKSIANFSWEQIGKMMVGLGGVLLQLVGFMLLTSYLPIGTGQLGGFITFALSITILVLTLQTLAGYSWEQLGKMMASLGVILLELAGFFALLKLINPGKMNIGMIGMFGFVISGIIGTLKPLAEMSLEQIAKMAVGLGAFLIEIVASIGLLKAMKIENATLMGFNMFSLSLLLLVKALEPLAGYSWMQIGKMLVSLEVILMEMAGIMFLITKINPIKSDITALVGSCIGLGLLAIALGIALSSVKDVDWKVIGVFSAGIAMLMAGAAAAIKMMSGIKLGKGIGAIILMGAAVAAIVLVVSQMLPLMSAPVEGLAAAFAGLSIMLVSLTFVTSMLINMSKTATGTKISGILITIGMLAAVAGLMVGLSYAISKIKNVKFDVILSFTVGMGVLMVAMAGAMKLMNNVSPKGAIIGLVALVAGLAAIMGVVGLLGGWMLDSLSTSLPAFGESLKALGEGLKSFSDSTSGLQNANIDAAVGLLAGIAKVQLALTSQNIKLAVFSALTGQDIEPGNLEQFGKDVATVGKFIGDFAAAITGKDFTNVDTAVKALSSIADVQSALTGQEIKLALFNKLMGLEGEDKIKPASLQSFADDVVAIAPALATIGDTLSGTDFGNFEQAAKAIGAMYSVQSAMNAEEIKMSIFSKLVGVEIKQGDIQGFVNDILIIAPKLAEIGDQLAQTNFEHFEQAAKAINTLYTVQSTMNADEIKMSIFKSLTGQDIKEGDIQGFVNDILTVAPKLVEIGNQFANTDFTNFEQAAKAINTLYTVQSTMNAEEIKMSIFKSLTGQDIKEGDLVKFVDNVKTIAPKLVEIGDYFAAENTNFENVTKAAEAIKAFADVQKVLSEAGIKEALANMVLDIFGSDNEVEAKDLEDFAEDIVPLGEAMAKFATAVSYIDMGEGKIESVDTEAFKTAIEAIEALGSLQDVLNDSNIGGLFSWVTGHSIDMPTFASGLGYLGEGIRNIYENIYAIKDGKAPDPSEIAVLSSLLENISKFASFMNVYQKYIKELDLDNMTAQLRKIIDVADPESISQIETMTGLLNGIGAALQSIGYYGKPQISGAISEAIEELTGDTSKLEKEIKKFMANTGSTDIGSIFGVISEKVSEKKENGEITFRDVGYYMAAGMAAGILDGSYLVETAAKTLADRARDAAMAESGEHSPSTVFAMIGAYMSEGLAIGINSKSGMAGQAAEGLANDAINKAQDAMALFATAMSQEIDANPTITPVLDLSNITAGSELINSLLGQPKTMSLAGAGGDYSSRAIPKYDNGTVEYKGPDLSSINTAIQNLGARIDAMGNQISNIQIVLDSGALVGGVADGVNKKFGAKVVYGRRRN